MKIEVGNRLRKGYCATDFLGDLDEARERDLVSASNKFGVCR